MESSGGESRCRCRGCPGRAEVATRRAAGANGGAPATAPTDTGGAISFPCTSISWCAIIAVVINILHPFPDVALHIVQTPRIGLLLANLMRLTSWVCTVPCIISEL